VRTIKEGAVKLVEIARRRTAQRLLVRRWSVVVASLLWHLLAMVFPRQIWQLEYAPLGGRLARLRMEVDAVHQDMLVEQAVQPQLVEEEAV
jgi:hypothetical protein